MLAFKALIGECNCLYPVRYVSVIIFFRRIWVVANGVLLRAKEITVIGVSTGRILM